MECTGQVGLARGSAHSDDCLGAVGDARPACVGQRPDRTLERSDRVIDFALEVANRCQTAPVTENSTRILIMLLGKGEPWEQDHIAHVAIDTLRKVNAASAGENFIDSEQS